MPNGNTAGAERQYRAMDGAVPNRDTEGANRRDYSAWDAGSNEYSAFPISAAPRVPKALYFAFLANIIAVNRILFIYCPVRIVLIACFVLMRISAACTSYRANAIPLSPYRV